MKKKIYILFLLLFVFNMIIAQTSKIKTVSINGETYFVYPEFQNKRHSNDLSIWRNSNIIKKYELDSNTNINGKWIQFYKNSTSKIAKKFTLKSGKINGVCTKYYPNDIKEAEIEYKDGEIYGFWVSWYQNGQVMDSIKYISSSRIYCKRWYKNGNLELIESYNNLGQKNGEWIYFYKNGQERIKIIYTKDKVKNGYYCEYYPNGNKKRYGTLKNGLLNGRWEEWFENGNIKSVGEFKNDKYTYCGMVPFTKYYEYKVGKWVYYYKNGNISASGYYKPSIINIETVCKNGANLHCGTFSKEWKTFNFNGKEINIKSLIKKKILKDKEVFLKRLYE